MCPNGACVPKGSSRRCCSAARWGGARRGCRVAQRGPTSRLLGGAVQVFLHEWDECQDGRLHIVAGAVNQPIGQVPHGAIPLLGIAPLEHLVVGVSELHPAPDERHDSLREGKGRGPRGALDRSVPPPQHDDPGEAVHDLAAVLLDAPLDAKVHVVAGVRVQGALGAVEGPLPRLRIAHRLVGHSAGHLLANHRDFGRGEALPERFLGTIDLDRVGARHAGAQCLWRC
mmetsp:Transcript_24643/g.62359  ORF Transcript_24643/g.62359 Transcript_24643/m.62359 type:complete len:228 (-) Transcript_24643:50-733(-)